MPVTRIKPIDGLRAFSALGVVWIHVWTFFKNPPLKLFSIDLYQLFAIVGNGVDFFFVISGFCMYLMTSGKEFTAKNYRQFLYKRFLRIAPAFYLSIVVYALVTKFTQPGFEIWYAMIFNFLFLQNIVPGAAISVPFWSIGTEWHFYMLLPFFIYLSRRLSIVKAVLLFSICSIILFCFANLGYLSYDWWQIQILVRFPEFGVGIIAAYYFMKEKDLPGVLSGRKGLILAVCIMYLGRAMRFTPVLHYAGKFAFLSRSLADVVMTVGFGILLLHVVTQKSFLSTWLSGGIITYLGRISYSIYLWHSLVIYSLYFLPFKIEFANFSPVIGFVCVSGVTIFISHFSYRYLESFYFKMGTKKVDTFILWHTGKAGK